MILETTFMVVGGGVPVTDFMTRRENGSDLVRIVKGMREDPDAYSMMIETMKPKPHDTIWQSEGDDKMSRLD